MLARTRLCHRIIFGTVFGVPGVPAYAGSYSFTDLVPPGAVYAVATGVNGSDVVTGVFGDASKADHGFVWKAGSFTEVDVAGASGTALETIDAAGLAVGSYVSAGTKNRAVFTFDAVAMTQAPLPVDTKDSVTPAGINRHGVIVGEADGGSGATFGFVGKGSKSKLLKDPASIGPSTATAINDLEEIVGWTTDSAGLVHGFTFAGKAFTAFDPPQSVATIPSAISDGGVVGGTFTNTSGTVSGFILTGGAATTVSFPGSASTSIIGFGSKGEIVGNYVDTAGATHGYVLVAGTYYPIDEKGASDTVITAVGPNGTLVGYHTTGHSKQKAFVATCARSAAPCTQS